MIYLRVELCEIIVSDGVNFFKAFYNTSMRLSNGVIWGHSNNTRHFLGLFHTPPLPLGRDSFHFRKYSFLKTFAVKFSSKKDKKMTRDILVDPPPPSTP